MLRFVDMRDADIVGGRFAFFDTVRDRFVTVGGFMAWDSRAEFESNLAMESVHSEVAALGGKERFTALMPEWTQCDEGGESDAKAE